MWLEFILFLVPCITVFAILGITFQSSDPETLNHQKPKVVSLGYVLSATLWIRCLWSQHVPNYEFGQWLNNKYGSIFVLKLPFKRQVLLNISDLGAAKYVMNSSAWANRFPSDYYFYKILGEEPLGSFFGNGGYWKEGRQVTLRLLHQFGFFKEEIMEKIVQFEAREFCKQELLGKIQMLGCVETSSAVLKVHHMFQTYTLSIVSQVIMGRRFDKGDPIAERLLHAANRLNETFNVGTNVSDAFPWLWQLPISRFPRRLIELNRMFKEFLQKEVIGQRRVAGSYRTDPVDFVDYFLLEVDRRAEKNPCYVNDSNLMACLRDLILGGLDSTNAALEHAILHVCLQPSIQGKVRAEIDEVIGATREPCYEDRKRMPYTLAVLYETLRFATPVPATSRCPLRDVEFQGSTVIPKDSMVAINLYALHHSPDIWNDPDSFRPERFLNEKNELANLNKIMPFGYGKRVCLGEFTAKMTFFMFFVSILQNFTLELSKEHPPPSMMNKMGLSRGPFPYYITIKRRDCVEMRQP